MNRSKMILLLGGIGFVMGVLYLNIIALEYFKMTGIFNRQYLDEYIAVETNQIDLSYLVLVRVVPLCILVLATFTKVNKIVVLISILWVGFLFGLYLSLGSAQLGIMGVVLCIMALLPHIVFYIPAIAIIAISAYNYPNSRWNVAKVIAVLISMCCGIMCEVNLNPVLLKWFIDKM